MRLGSSCLARCARRRASKGCCQGALSYLARADLHPAGSARSAACGRWIGSACWRSLALFWGTPWSTAPAPRTMPTSPVMTSSPVSSTRTINASRVKAAKRRTGRQW